MDIEALRRDTPGTANRIHLNNAGAGWCRGGPLRP
jgi:hypothetical protein